MTHILLVPLYVTGCAKYLAAQRLFSGNWLKFRWYFPGLIATIFLTIFAPATANDADLRILIRLIAAAGTFFLLAGGIGKKLTTFLILTISLEALTEFFEVLLYGMERTGLTDVQNLVSDTLALLALLLYAFLDTQVRAMNLDNVAWMKRVLPFFTVVASLVVVFTIEGVAYAAAQIHDGRFRGFAYLASLTGTLGVMAAMWTAVYLYRANDRLQSLSESEAKNAKIQLEYLEALLEVEELTRRYRHDMKNHLICLEELAGADRGEELKQYLDTLLTELPAARGVHYHTGVRVCDALTSFYLERLAENVAVRMQGQLPENGGLSDRELCTVYGNLLSNAVEALEANESEAPVLNIRFREGDYFAAICIENSCAGDIRYDARGRLLTRKKDKKDHGIGLKNVEDCLKRHGGSLSTGIENGLFTAEAIWERAEL